MSTALSTGTFVNKDTTSNDTRVVPSGSFCFVTKLANSNELAVCDEVLPTNGDNKVTKCFDNSYVGELMKETIGLKGIPSL